MKDDDDRLPIESIDFRLTAVQRSRRILGLVSDGPLDLKWALLIGAVLALAYAVLSLKEKE